MKSIVLDAASWFKQTTLNIIHSTWVELNDNVVSSHGITLDLSSPVVSRRIKGFVSRGLYETGEIELIDRHLATDTDLIELGGGIGFVAAYTNARLDDDVKHIVLEANPSLAPLLETTKECNDSTYVIENRAYAPGETAVKLFTREHFWSNSTRSNSGTTKTVPATDLGRITNEYDIERFTLIVDIEGAEYDLIDELDLLERNCETLIVEFHDTKQEHASLSAKIDELRQALNESTFTCVEEDETKGVYVNE